MTKGDPMHRTRNETRQLLLWYGLKSSAARWAWLGNRRLCPLPASCSTTEAPASLFGVAIATKGLAGQAACPAQAESALLRHAADVVDLAALRSATQTKEYRGRRG